jgi:hypothetical protein
LKHAIISGLSNCGGSTELFLVWQIAAEARNYFWFVKLRPKHAIISALVNCGRRTQLFQLLNIAADA